MFNDWKRDHSGEDDSLWLLCEKRVVARLQRSINDAKGPTLLAAEVSLCVLSMFFFVGYTWVG